MLSKKTKQKGQKKKKTLPLSVDPDDPFRLSLDELHYIPKKVRECITAAYLQRIDLAIMAFTLAQPPIDSVAFFPQEKRIRQEIATLVPMMAVPPIVRALGFNPTTQQMRQIVSLVLSEVTQSPVVVEGSNSEELMADKPQREEQEEEATESSTSVVSVTDKYITPTMLADRKKLETLAIEMLHTGLLVYDPVIVGDKAAVAGISSRVVTVVERGDPTSLDDVFDVLWASLKGTTCDDGETRCITSVELRQFLEKVAPGSSEEPPFTREELDTFLQYACDLHSEALKEDTFALTAYYGS